MNIANLNMMRALVKELRKEAPELPIQQLQVFLEVLANEGLSVEDIKNRTGMNGTSASRNYRALLQHAGAGREGLGWIRWEPSPHDLRVKKLFTTEKGREIAERVQKLLER